MNIRQETEWAIKEVLLKKQPKEQVLERLLTLGIASSTATITQLFYGSLRFYNGFLSQLEQLCVKGKLPSELHSILVIALYQLKYMDSIPDYAVMNETIDLIQKVDPRRKKFCTWLLHEWLRRSRSENIADKMPFQPFPDWFERLLRTELGPERVAEFTKRFLFPPRNYWFVPEARRECFSEYALSENLPVYESPDSPSKRQRRIESCGGVVCDLYSILLPYYFSDIKTGDFLDIGSAPGNKLIVAKRRFPELHFVAIEKHEQRMSLLKKRLSLACGFQNMDLLKEDALDWLCKSERLFDRILLDAPCSGLGTILSHPEFLLTKKEADCTAKQELQIKLLSMAMDSLKSGGELIYSVCSFLQAETEEVVARALKPGYEIKRVENLLGEDQLQKEFGTLLCVSEKLGNQIFYLSRIVRK